MGGAWERPRLLFRFSPQIPLIFSFTFPLFQLSPPTEGLQQATMVGDKLYVQHYCIFSNQFVF